MRGTERAALAAAVVVVVAIAWGGAFAPTPELVVTAALAIIAGAAAATWHDRLEPAECLTLGVIGWGVLSAAVAHHYPLAARETLAAWLVAWVLLVLARRARGASRTGVLALMAGAGVLVAVAVLGATLAAGAMRLGGMYRNPNVAIALIVPPLAILGTAAGWRIGRWRWPLAALVVAAVVASGSRAGLFALVVAAAVGLPRRRLRWLAVAAVAAGAAAIVAWRFLIHPDALAWYRPTIWRALLSLVGAHPLLGVGPGWLEDATGVIRLPHAEAVASFRHIIGSAESTPLGLLVRTGIGGAALGVAAVAAWALRLRREGLAGGRAQAVVVAVMAAMALFHDFLDQPVVLWEWALLSGCLFPVAPAAESVDGRRPAPARGARLAAGLAVTWLLLWGAAEPAYARRLWWDGTPSIDLARRALRAEPRYAEPAEWVTRHMLMQPSWTWETAGRALSWSRCATRLHDGSAKTWSDFGLVNARIVDELGSWPDAVAGARRGYGRATELEPHLPWHWLRWAELERALGNPTRALELAQRAVAEEPNFVRGWLYCSRLELDLGRSSPARKAYRRAREAMRLGVGRTLSDYERDLLEAPVWQVRELAALLGDASGADARGGGP